MRFLWSSSGLTLAQPPQQHKKWNQRKGKKDGPTTAVDYAVNHLGAHIHAEEADHENSEAIPQDGERNDEGDKRKAPPRGL